MSLSLLLSTLTCQVKRRLQEVILQRKRREAAASMGNLPTLIPGPPGELSLVHTLAMLTSDWSGAPSGAAAGPPTALLRKVQSESNLLKIKNRRERAGAGAPYSHRGANMHGNNILPKVSIDSKFIFTLPCAPQARAGCCSWCRSTRRRQTSAPRRAPPRPSPAPPPSSGPRSQSR